LTGYELDIEQTAPTKSKAAAPKKDIEDMLLDAVQESSEE
jgi:hypothetical protein